MELRDYQVELDEQICTAWESARNVLAVLPTGGGKTVIFSHILERERGLAIVMAHRQELVSQIALSLARSGVRHRVVGGTGITQVCAQVQAAEIGSVFINPHARIIVAGVDTIIRRQENWFSDVALWVMDEAHHLLRRNKWGTAVDLFPNARGLGVTATPVRADGHGLGRHAEGVFDVMVEGPPQRELIRRGYLTDYRIIAPPSNLHLEDVTVSAGGDYSPPKLAEAVHKSSITGDAVRHYLRFAKDKLGVTFCVDVAAAKETTQAYREAGISAEMITAGTAPLSRSAILRRFRNREILQLVNVDLFGEGFDLPAIEVVTFLRPTASYGLYVQQFGRSLRILLGKQKAIILDHVGNTLRHGLPDRPRVWSLDSREKRGRGTSDAPPLRVCSDCMGVYEKVYRACPYCGHVPEPGDRSSPEYVDGDLAELSPDVLARLRGEIQRIDGAVQLPMGATGVVAGAIIKRHRQRAEAQELLRDAMALWGGQMTSSGYSVHEAQRLFYHTFKVDVATAQALGRPDALALLGKILQC